jgi:type IV secretory pathway VirB10-like protein
MGTTDQVPPPTPKIDPERVALRASPRPVTRLNRRMLAVLGGTLAVAVSIGALWALRSHGPKHGGAQQSYNVDRVAKAEELDRLPPDYSKLASKPSPASAEPPPELGPPLPGDWAPAALQAERSGGLPSGNSPSAEGIDRQRSAEDVARSSVFFQTSSAGKAGVDANAPSMPVPPTASMGAFNPMTPLASPTAAQPGDPTTLQNRQDQKEAFLTKTGDAATRNSAELQASASPYTVMAGTIIPAALVTGINSDLPGQVIATVTQPIYDTGTGRSLLIPQGSRLLGRYDSQVAFGQRRVLLVWTRLILPDTSSIALDKLPGIDPAGYAGLEDGVDWHWGRILSGAALATLLGVSSELAVSDQGSTNGNVVIALRDSAQDTTNQVGQEITRRNLSVQPTLTIRPGFPMEVMVNKDLVLRPYQPLFFGRGVPQ